MKNNEKKIFETPKIEFLKIHADDILTTSPETNWGDELEPDIFSGR